MQTDFMDEDQSQPYSFYFYRSFWGLIKAAANVAKYFFAPFGGGTCAVIDLYTIYQYSTIDEIEHRTSKIIATVLSFCANAFFTVGAVLTLLNPIGLMALACSAALPSLLQSSYATKKAADEENLESTFLSQEASKDKFRAQCATVYNAIKLLGNILLFASVFFPPLLIAGIIILGAVTILEHVEQKNNFRFARSVCRLFSSDPTHDAITSETELVTPTKKPTRNYVPIDTDIQKTPTTIQAVTQENPVTTKTKISRQKPLPATPDLRAIIVMTKERVQRMRSRTHYQTAHTQDSGNELTPLRNSTYCSLAAVFERSKSLSAATTAITNRAPKGDPRLHEDNTTSPGPDEKLNTNLFANNSTAEDERLRLLLKSNELKKPIKPASRIVP